MQCTYINLQSDQQKKFALEESFHKNNVYDWTLQRFNAIDKEYIRKNNIKGNISEGAKGCFLSHRALINEKIGSDSHIFIAEDDIVFSNHFQPILSQILTNETYDWDLLYTDICIPDATTMLELFKIKQECKSSNDVRILDLQSINFASTAAYIVNKKSIGKIASILNSINEINIPIDLLYRELIHASELMGSAIFPFLTSLSSQSEKSNIQSGTYAYTEAVWHGFRKLIWMDGSVQDIQNNLRQIERETFTDEAHALLTLIGGTLSENYNIK